MANKPRFCVEAINNLVHQMREYLCAVQRPVIPHSGHHEDTVRRNFSNLKNGKNTKARGGSGDGIVSVSSASHQGYKVMISHFCVKYTSMTRHFCVK